MNKEIFKKIAEEIKYKPHYHYVCYAGSTICRVDKWGEKSEMDCKHKGSNDWGILDQRECPCKHCNGKLPGFLDLEDWERAENFGIDRLVNACIKKVL